MERLGPLVDEDPEPMTRDHFIAAQKRLRESWSGVATFDNRDVRRMLDEIRWLKKRLQRVEHAVAPLVSAIRNSRR
jgi:hypothetical protein